MTRPEAFGQHSNADITSQFNDSNALLDSLLSLQPQNVSTGGMSREEEIFDSQIENSTRTKPQSSIYKICLLLNQCLGTFSSLS
jgi:hypothetical protein